MLERRTISTLSKAKAAGGAVRARRGEKRVDAIYRTLFEAILAQELMPGTKLGEETLGEVFGVSRTVVRAVLNRLASNALIELKPNRGAFVASPSLDEARQVFRARIAIERAIAADLAAASGTEIVRQLEAHVVAERAAEAAGDEALATRLSGEFHLLAARLAGNAVLAEFLRQLISRSSLAMALYGRPAAHECGVDEHADFVAAVAARDSQRAVAVMTSHLEGIVDRARLADGRKPVRTLAEILAGRAV